MLTVTQLKALLDRHGLRLTKRLGQHYLVDARLIERLLDAAALSPDAVVVEVGAGLGALTEPLARRVTRVIAVEIDRGVAALLRERMRAFPNVEVVCGDILQFAWPREQPVTVVGAIPYQITSPLLVSLSQQRRAITQAVLILQEELARRLLASPGTREYGRLSILVQYSWRITSLSRVSAAAFFPRPRVESRCVKLLPRPEPSGSVKDERGLFELVRHAFAHRRKTLVNGLLDAGVNRRQALEVLNSLGLPPAVRAEALSLQQWIALADVLSTTPPSATILNSPNPF